jgi:hypothetical protein
MNLLKLFLEVGKMKRYLLCLSLVISLCLVGNVVGGVPWSGGGGVNRLWSTGANWNTGVPPVAGDDVFVDWHNTSPLIDSTVTALGGTLRVGSFRGPEVIEMTGGSLTLTSHFILAQGTATGTGTFNFSGGTVTANSLWTGNQVAWGNGIGTMYMTGGTMNLTGEGLYVSRPGGASSLGVQLDGGIINAASIYFGDGGMDITAGKLVLPSIYQGRVVTYIDKSWITGYGSKDNVVITTVGNTIEVTAIPEPATLFVLGMGGLALLRKKR